MEVSPLIRNAINKYPDFISPYRNIDIKYCGVYHRIDNGSHTPVYSIAKHLFVEKYNATCAEFKTLQNDRMISPSKSEWPSPLHMIAKQSGEYRCCGDYHSVNKITRSDRYPLPNMNSFSAKPANKHRFSKFDFIFSSSPYQNSFERYCSHCYNNPIWTL